MNFVEFEWSIALILSTQNSTITFRLSQCMWSQSTNVTDKQTDRRTDGQTTLSWQYRAAHVRASRAINRTCCHMLIDLLITLSPVVFSVLTHGVLYTQHAIYRTPWSDSLPTASITPLKQPYCISTIISSMPLNHRSCLVFVSWIFLALSTLTITSWSPAFHPVMLKEAKTSRPRPELRGWGWGRGQFLEVEAKDEAKNNYEKAPNTNND